MQPRPYNNVLWTITSDIVAAAACFPVAMALVAPGQPVAARQLAGGTRCVKGAREAINNVL